MWIDTRGPGSEMSQSSQGLDCFQIQGYIVGLLPKLRHAPSSTFLFVYVGNYQLRQWQFSADGQAHLSLQCSHMRKVPKSHELGHFMNSFHENTNENNKYIVMQNCATNNLFLGMCISR